MASRAAVHPATVSLFRAVRLCPCQSAIGFSSEEPSSGDEHSPSILQQPHRLPRVHTQLERETLDETAGDHLRPRGLCAAISSRDQIAKERSSIRRKLRARARPRSPLRPACPPARACWPSPTPLASPDPRSASALGHGPVIEIGGVAHKEAVEEIAPVQIERVGPSLLGQRPPKFDDVGPDEIRRQSQRLARRDDRPVAERLPQHVERVGQEVSRGPLIAVRPK